MRISVKVKPKSKKEYVKTIDATHFIVAVSESPEKGKANAAVEKALAEHFGVPRLNIIIISGHTSREKIVEVMKVK